MGFGYRASRLKGSKHKAISNINITPFVDVVLVLLIIFMVTAPMLNNGFDVNLPKVASNQVSINKKEQIIFTVDKSDKIRVGDKVLTLKEVNTYLQDYNALNTQIFIKGDKGANYGLVIELMSIINKNGFNNLSLVTEPLK